MSSLLKPADRRYFIGGSDARIIMGDDEAALIRLWRETSAYLRRLGFRKRTPRPPPFSSRNSIPAASRALSSLARASSETRGPVPVSTRFTVGSDSPARSASSD